MNRSFLYFINPISGTKGKALLPEMIRRKSIEQNIPFEILHTNAAGDYSWLKEKIAVQKITDVVICAGDGTINQVAGALLSVDVNIGIIPMGSGNGLAFTASIPRKPELALDLVFRGNTQYVDSFFINGQFSCMLSGIGLDAQVAHDFAAQKKRGLLTYIKQSAKNFFSAKAYPFVLYKDNAAFSTEAFFISVANSNQFGNNFTIAPEASLSDGLLDIVVVSRMSKWTMLWAVLKQVRKGKVTTYPGSGEQKGRIAYFQVKKILIQNPSLARLHIDGDPATTAATFDIELIPAAFRLLIP